MTGQAAPPTRLGREQDIRRALGDEIPSGAAAVLEERPDRGEVDRRECPSRLAELDRLCAGAPKRSPSSE